MFDEIELKFGLEAGEALRLGRSPVLRGVRSSRRLLHSVYFDTPDFSLMRQGVALRLRKVGRRWLQTVKAESRQVGALSTRPEWEMPVRGGRLDIASLPEAARAFFPPDIVAALQPCFSTRFERTTWEIAQDGDCLELALDRGEVRAGRKALPILEVELELRAGRTEFLFDIAEQMLASVVLRLEPRSKAERGYQLAGAIAPKPLKAVPPATDAADSPGRAWRAMAAAAMAQLAGNVPGLLAADDPEYLHQARVAIRRLLAVVSLARSAGLRRPAWRDGLRGLMASFAPAREWDVFVGEILPSLPALSARQRGSLIDAAARMQRRTRRQARAALLSSEFMPLVLAVGRGLLGEAEGKGSIPQWAKGVLDRRWAKLKRLGKHFDRLDPGQRHRLRIAAKKLRYVADAFAPLYGPAALAYLEHLASLQDRLGAANDCNMALRLLADMQWEGSAGQRLRGVVERRLEERATQGEAGLLDCWRALLKVPPFWRKAPGQLATSRKRG